MAKEYIGSQQHFEDNINDSYDERERHNKEQIDDQEQPDDRVAFCDNPIYDFDNCPLQKWPGGCKKCNWYNE